MCSVIPYYIEKYFWIAVDFWNLRPKQITSVVPLFTPSSILLLSVSIILKAHIARQHSLKKKKMVYDSMKSF